MQFLKNAIVYLLTIFIVEVGFNYVMLKAIEAPTRKIVHSHVKNGAADHLEKKRQFSSYNVR